MAFEMAQAHAMARTNSEEAAVAHSVHNLIHAFTDGLDVFKRLKERRRKKRTKHKYSGDGGGGGGGEKSGGKEFKDDAESQLSLSLRRGPREIREKYGKCYIEKGEDFARGDAIAHASLAEILIKLNTGLVSIIATFLNHDPKDKSLKLDYKSLTDLSEASRREAMDSLNQLYWRLSQSQLQIQRMKSPSPRPRGTDSKRARSTSRQRSIGPTTMVARASINGSSQTQLVMVRPKNKDRGRRASSSQTGTCSSGSSTKSPVSTAINSPSISPLASPLPQYSPRDPFPQHKLPISKAGAAAAASRKRADSFHDYRPTTWPQTRTDDDHLAPLPLPAMFPSSSSSSRRNTTIASPSSPLEKQPLNAAQAVAKRRLDKLTPSTYTFASDSTKLGEIPQRKWNQPWDYEEAARLNEVAAAAGVQIPVEVARRAQRKKQGGGLLGFLRRGSTGGA